ncbi:MAG: serine--tRNA ligase [Paracoccaceae bacterium]|jgi:seryl-tRNA synthetase|nr:serine--tRNA ligase [Paracoccaceae bacterium]
MHNIRMIRENPAEFDNALKRRGLSPLSEMILAIDSSRRLKISVSEKERAEQNKAAKDAGLAKANGDEEEFQKLRTLVSRKKDEIQILTSQARDEDQKLYTLLMGIPNMVSDEIPNGDSELSNVEIKKWGKPKQYTFSPKEHFEVSGAQPGMDFENAAKISGSRFVILHGAIAQLHRALAQFMLDTHIQQNGLSETWAPVIVNEAMMYGTGNLPKFGEDSYQTTTGQWLIPTAEVTLTNIINGLTVDESSLPHRYCAHSQCFRSEAGSAGRDTAGMLRQHQFEKVEMVSITTPDTSVEEHSRMTKCAEGLLEALELPYRTVVLCAGDIGFGAKVTHDIEVWLPGQEKYREISSVSLCGDFQARRMNARYKPEDSGKPEFVHTLNGSGLAVGRSLIAVIENYQNEDGSITVPSVLTKYMGGKSLITDQGKLN